MFTIKLFQHIPEKSTNIASTEVMLCCERFEVVEFKVGDKDLIVYRPGENGSSVATSYRIADSERLRDELAYPLYACAYIMNSDGKTIDKVNPSAQTQELKEAHVKSITYGTGGTSSTDALALIKEFLGYGGTEGSFCKLDKNKIGYILCDSKVGRAMLDEAINTLADKISIKYHKWSYDEAAALFECSNGARLKFLPIEEAGKMTGPEDMWIRHLAV